MFVIERGERPKYTRSKDQITKKVESNSRIVDELVEKDKSTTLDYYVEL